MDYPESQPDTDKRRCSKTPNSFRPAYVGGQQICSYSCADGTSLRLNNGRRDPRLGWVCPNR
jgi:hypothetical protein